jgi:hypothetical protein
MITITGNTFPVKEQLKALGAKWYPAEKVWKIAEDKAGEAQKIVASALPSPRRRTYGGPGPRGPAGRFGKRCYCRECGEPYVKGRRCWETGMECVPEWE